MASHQSDDQQVDGDDEGTIQSENINTFLKKPITDKETILEEDDQFVVGQSSMQGWRKTMEDVAVVWLKIPGDTTNTKYFAIFDGHGGKSVAQYAGTFLIHCIMNQPEWSTDLKEAIRKGFVECDQQLRDEKDPRQLMIGSTALTVFIRELDARKLPDLTPGGTKCGCTGRRKDSVQQKVFSIDVATSWWSFGNQLYCGNIGDSRAIASEADQIVRLSKDHKPTLPGERERIMSAGGHVYQERVNGSLGLSRALGDFAYKKQRSPPEHQMVTPVPDILKKTVDKQWQFIVMACDGVWEVLNDESVLKFVRTRLFQKKNPAQVAESLIHHCLAPASDVYAVGCDNMTATVIMFKWAQFAPTKLKALLK